MEGTAMINRRARRARSVLGAHGVPVPTWWEEYGVRAEYVVSDGVTNYIETLLQIQKNITIELDVEYLSVSGKERSLFGGANTSVNPRAVVEVGSITSVGKFFYGYGSNWNVIDDAVPVANTRYKLKYVLNDAEQVLYIDDVEVYRNPSPKAGVPNSLLMYLFARNINGTATNLVLVKLYGAKVTNADGLLLDYMPLYVTEKSITDVNGKEYPIGSYILVDNVSKKATVLNGKPLGGAIALPDWVYEMGTPIYGIKTSGDSYIDTGFSPTPDLATVDSFTLLDTKNGTSITISGCRSAYANANSYALWKLSTNGKFRFDNGAAVDIYSNDIVQPNVRYNIVRTPTDITINGIVQTSKPSTITTGSALSIYIGTVNNSGSALYYPAPLIIHEWAGKNADKEVKLIAFIHNDGTVGMLDLVTRQMFGSATGTPFEAVTVESTSQTLRDIGIEPTMDVEENIGMLNEMGVLI